jgi:hypothetical protein
MSEPGAGTFRNNASRGREQAAKLAAWRLWLARALRDPVTPYCSFCLRAVIAVTAPREALCLTIQHERGRAARSFQDVLSPTTT